MDSDLVERLRAAAQESFADGPVLFAYLFGSRAKGRPRPDSDTDIAVLLEDGLSDSERFWFSVTPPLPLLHAARTEVDLVVLNDASLPFQGRVLTARILLYSRDEERRIEYETHTFKLFADFEPRLEAMARAYLSAVGRGEA